jgi:hypothetical protein
MQQELQEFTLVVYSRVPKSKTSHSNPTYFIRKMKQKWKGFVLEKTRHTDDSFAEFEPV